MKRLQDVGEEFLEYVHRLDAAPLQEKDNSLVGNFLSKVGWKQEQKPEQHEAPRSLKLPQAISRFGLTYICPVGFYMYGDVGCGKTMLMDLFLDSLPVKHKKRVHFNSFMQSFHDAIHKWRTSPSVKVCIRLMFDYFTPLTHQPL
jgi:predicted ATPase